ncbi:hypothetical protein ACERII_17100 [Evansella sp. AB-rgal1]|uniref:hypothetical protein n=1 Tax=Evansella sp. AB-rgal1 TaxID=3242696 RepID=UPI00359DD73B
MYILLSIMGIFIALINKLTDRFVTGEFENVSESDGKLVEIWGYIIIIGTVILLIFTVVDISDDRTMMWFFATVKATILGFQAWTEWKYLEGTKHIATFLLMVVSVITFLGITDVLEQRKYTSFEEVVYEKLEVSEIEKVDITKHSGGAAWLTLKDTAQIERLLADFKDIEFKEGYNYESSRYTITIYGGHNKASNSTFTLLLKEEGFMTIRESTENSNKYKEYVIINEVNYLEFLESEELEWKQ